MEFTDNDFKEPCSTYTIVQSHIHKRPSQNTAQFTAIGPVCGLENYYLNKLYKDVQREIRELMQD